MNSFVEKRKLKSKHILNYIRSFPRCTTNEIALNIKMSFVFVDRLAHQLEKEGKIEKEYKTKKAHVWRIKRKEAKNGI